MSMNWKLGNKKLSWKEVKELRKPIGEHFVVEKIQKKWVGKDGEVLYHVRWWGYPKSYDTWEPPSSFASCPRMLEDYEKERETRRAAYRRKKQGRRGRKKVKKVCGRQNQGDNPEMVCLGEPEIEIPNLVETPKELVLEEQAEEETESGLEILQAESITMGKLEHYQRISGVQTAAHCQLEQPVFNEELEVPTDLSSLNTEELFYKLMDIEAYQSTPANGSLDSGYPISDHDATMLEDYLFASNIASPELDIPTLDAVPILHQDDVLSSTSLENERVPSLVLEQSPVNDQHIRILQYEEVIARQLAPKFIGATIIKNEFHYIAKCQDDGGTVSIRSAIAFRVFPNLVSKLLAKIPLKLLDDFCWLLREGYCRLWEGNDFKDLFVVRMHIDQQRYLILPTDPGCLLCENCLLELEYAS